MTGDRMLRLALRLYPAPYRAERGAEIAAVYADTTADADGFVRARELYGVAAHGVRQRLRLTASRPTGRLFGEAAPLIVGAGAGAGLFWLLLLQQDLRSGRAPLLDLIWCAPYALALPALAAVLLGHGTLTRGFAALALAGAVLQQGAWFAQVDTVRSLMLVPVLATVQAAWALLLLAAPRELLRRPRRWWPAVAMAAMVPVAVAGTVLALLGHGAGSALLDLLALLFAGGLVLLLVRQGGQRSAAVALAWLPALLPFVGLGLTARAGSAQALGLVMGLLAAGVGYWVRRSRPVAHSAG
jgi:hypothetical protein